MAMLNNQRLFSARTPLQGTDLHRPWPVTQFLWLMEALPLELQDRDIDNKHRYSFVDKTHHCNLSSPIYIYNIYMCVYVLIYIYCI